jgi:putative MFS transporter
MLDFADHGSPKPSICTTDRADRDAGLRRAQSTPSGVGLSSLSPAGTETTSIQLMSTTIAARLDGLPISRTIFKMVTLISLGGFFEFYDIFLTAYIAPGLYKSGMFSPVSSNVFGSDNIATFIAVFFAGLFVSTLFLSRIADRFGRRTIFNFSLLWYSVCTVAMAFQTSSPAILFFRFAAGIGIGMELVVIDTYLSELVPKTSRGRAFAFNQLLSFLAIPVVALASFFLVPRSFWGIDGWRWVTPGLGIVSPSKLRYQAL